MFFLWLLRLLHFLSKNSVKKMSTKPLPPTYTMKVILVGSSGVGKTCLVSSYFENPFDVQALPTVAPASCNATITLPSNERVELQIWDTAGQERFQAISQMFYRDSHIAFVCFDNTSIDTVANWVERVRSEVAECLIFLVLTKADMYTLEELEDLKHKGLNLKEEQEAYGFYYTSSKKRIGIEELFVEAAKCCNLVYQSNRPTVDIGDSSVPQEKKGCC